MSEKMASEMISRRRALSFLGLAALSLAVPPVVLTMSDAEAQQPAAPPTGTSTAAPKGPETGTERRQERRKGRQERREARRKGREKRREEPKSPGTTG
jgi:hypothetical protein